MTFVVVDSNGELPFPSVLLRIPRPGEANRLVFTSTSTLS